MTREALRRTSLYDIHVASGARMVPFAGWEMPVQYTSIVDEHRAVRTHAGLFDVSHMGEVEVAGPGARDTVQWLITNDAGRLRPGDGLYTPMCAAHGGILDDLTVFCLDDQRFLFVVNAATTDKDFRWIAGHLRGAEARDRSAELALLALQGPRAQAIVQRVTPADVAALRVFGTREDVEIAGVPVVISRTGYTGEDGFEIACPWAAAPAVWRALMDAGRLDGLVPVGLAARDTLRLEAGFMLYGIDIDETTTPLEAPLRWTVKWEKGDFSGRAALEEQKARGVDRRLVGFEIVDRAIARHGYPIASGGARVGEVTSGTFGPWVNKTIGMGYVERAAAKVGTALEIDIRGRPARAGVVKLPFYKRA
ncbi:MAG: glycine cleavage system aminomethyltransferase GcvT [bacterium]